jgi:hypothetical protein
VVFIGMYVEQPRVERLGELVDRTLLASRGDVRDRKQRPHVGCSSST